MQVEQDTLIRPAACLKHIGGHVPFSGHAACLGRFHMGAFGHGEFPGIGVSEGPHFLKRGAGSGRRAGPHVVGDGVGGQQRAGGGV